MSGNESRPVPSAENMQKLKSELEQTLQSLPDFDKLKKQIEMTITPEGLRIELLESATGTFFDLGNRAPNRNGQELLATLAQQLGKLPNNISIEGHTDSQAFSRSGDYGNWELSTDRANAARRMMQEQGLGPKQVSQVRGYADQMLRTPASPLDPANRRISVIVQYLNKPGDDKSGTEKPTAAQHPEAPATKH